MNPNNTIFHGSPEKWAEVVDQVSLDQVNWRPEELAAILRHQWSAPVEFFPPPWVASTGVVDTSSILARRKDLPESGSSGKAWSFKELFQCPNPPLDLLVKTKDFAKANLANAGSLLPREITTVLYYASLAAAWVRLGQRITQMDDAQWREGFGWVLALPWLDEATRELVSQAQDSFE